MPFVDSIRESEIRAIYRYWLKRRPAGGVPPRGSIDPVDIPPSYLPHLFLYVRDTDGRFRCRLMGTAIGQVFGFDATGHCLDDVLPATVARQRKRLFKEVLDRGLPAYFRGLAVTRAGGQRRYGQILLPVASSGSDADQIFGMALFGPVERPVPPAIAGRAFANPAQIIHADAHDLESTETDDAGGGNRAQAC